MRNKKNVCLYEWMGKLHKDQRGMSLVEVIVAITILGIVAVPVLHSLTTAMVYNAKARNRQEMTLTAENIMETFKGYDLEGDDPDTLVKRFESGTGIEGVAYQDATPGHSGYRHVPGAAPNEHIFYIYDMEADNGQLYDVTITAVPNGIEEIMEPENMEPTRDAIFKGDSQYDSQAHNAAFNDFIANHKGDLVSAFSDDADDKGYNGAYVELAGHKEQITEALVDNMGISSYIQIDEKRLMFTVSSSGSSSDETYAVTAKLQYTYHFADYPYYVKKEGASQSDPYVDNGGSQVPVENAEEWQSETLQWYHTENALSVDIPLSDPEENVYKNPAAAELARLFIYYYPNYGLDAGADQILIDNQTGISLQCFILKQRTQKFSSNSLKTKENGYKAYVKVTNSGGGSCEVYHNFYDNIGYGNGENGSTTAPVITGSNITGQYSYTTKSSDPPGTKPQLQAKFEKAQALSYRIRLEVTQGGRTITTLESTMNERIKKNER